MDVIPFQFGGAEVRTLMIDGQPWFAGKDVAELLGYQRSTDALRQHCDGVQKLHPILDSMGRSQDVRLITEPDVWRLVIGSHLPSAKAIERWIFEEVLPTIRRHGRYEGNDLSLPLAAPGEHPMVSNFWRVYDELDAKGERVNFSAKKHLIAIRLVEFRQTARRRGLDIGKEDQLKILLKASVARPFVGLERIKWKGGQARQSWVFEVSRNGPAVLPTNPSQHARLASPDATFSDRKRKLAEQCRTLGLRYASLCSASEGLADSLETGVMLPAQIKTLLGTMRHELHECLALVESVDFA